MSGSTQTFKSESTSDQRIDYFNQSCQRLLGISVQQFKSYGYKFLTGTESEFYLVDNQKDKIFSYQDYVSYLNSSFQDQDIACEVVCERGEGQFEFRSETFVDPLTAVSCYENSKSKIELLSTDYGTCDFSARPFPEDCPSALQINFSIYKNDSNLIYEDRLITEDLCNYLLRNIDDFFVFANDCDDDYSRYDLMFNKKLHKKGMFVAPTVKSWGYDNRSCAIRVFKDNDNSRIELRIASNSGNLSMLYCILLTHLGLFLSGDFDNNVYYDPVYGNAFDDKYGLEVLPKSQLQAQQRFLNSRIFDILRGW